MEENRGHSLFAVIIALVYVIAILVISGFMMTSLSDDNIDVSGLKDKLTSARGSILWLTILLTIGAVGVALSYVDSKNWYAVGTGVILALVIAAFGAILRYRAGQLLDFNDGSTVVRDFAFYNTLHNVATTVFVGGFFALAYVFFGMGSNIRAPKEKEPERLRFRFQR